MEISEELLLLSDAAAVIMMMMAWATIFIAILSQIV